MNGNKINQNNYSMNFKHSLSSAPISLKDIENLDIDDDEYEDENNDEETQSIKSYRTNMSEITNSTLLYNQQNHQYRNQQINQVQQFNQFNQFNQLNNQNQYQNYNQYQQNQQNQQNQINNKQNILNQNENQNNQLVPRKTNNFRFIDQTQIDLYEKQNQKNENNYEEDDDELREVLDESNPEFVQFKNNVREWLKLDDDIKTLQRAVAERRKKKNELTPNVLEFMGKYEIEDLNTHEGKVAYAKSMVTKPMNKDYLKTRLTEYLRSMDKAEKCTKFLMENRIKEERVRLKRVNPRKKQN